MYVCMYICIWYVCMYVYCMYVCMYVLVCLTRYYFSRTWFYIRIRYLSVRLFYTYIYTYHTIQYSTYIQYIHTLYSQVNKQLSLSAMTVSDVDNDPTYCSFFISHPVKVPIFHSEIVYVCMYVCACMYVSMYVCVNVCVLRPCVLMQCKR